MTKSLLRSRNTGLVGSASAIIAKQPYVRPLMEVVHLEMENNLATSVIGNAGSASQSSGTPTPSTGGGSGTNPYIITPTPTPSPSSSTSSSLFSTSSLDGELE